jgi:hypothetical protein
MRSSFVSILSNLGGYRNCDIFRTNQGKEVIDMDTGNLNSALFTLLKENGINDVKNVRLKLLSSKKDILGNIVFKDGNGKEIKLIAKVSHSQIVK